MKHWYWILDVAVVLSFAVVGVLDHGWELKWLGIGRIATPFLIALAIGTIAIKGWQKPISLVNGAILGIITLGGGMLLRNVLWNEGTPRLFVIVSAVWIIGLMIGWRLIALGIVYLRSRRAERSASS